MTDQIHTSVQVGLLWIIYLCQNVKISVEINQYILNS